MERWGDGHLVRDQSRGRGAHGLLFCWFCQLLVSRCDQGWSTPQINTTIITFSTDYSENFEACALCCSVSCLLHERCSPFQPIPALACTHQPLQA